MYQDSLLGIYDRHVDEDTYPPHFAKTAQLLAEAAKRSENCSYLFETLSALSSVLEVKCALGVELKKAYGANDREKLAALAKQAQEAAARVGTFSRTMGKQWFRENRPFGWEVLDIRLGGVKARLESAAQRVTDYLQGRTARIEELEEPRLVLDERENPGYRTLPLSDNNWKNISTACVL